MSGVYSKEFISTSTYSVSQITLPILCNKILLSSSNNTEYVEVDMNSFEYTPDNIQATYDHPVYIIQVYKNTSNTPLNGKMRSINLNRYGANTLTTRNANYYSVIVHTSYYYLWFYHDDTPLLRIVEGSTTNSSIDIHANFTFPFL